MLQLLLILVKLLVGASAWAWPWTMNNNACPTWYQYNTRSINTACWYNPDVQGELVDIAQRYNYPATVYNVTTSDGYILPQFRLGNSSGPPVLVVHGINQNPIGWTLEGLNSLAFVLADAGYDVWLASLRGTRYTSHQTLTRSDEKFWEYTPHEMGTIDLPAIISLIAGVTSNQTISLLSYSMGTTVSFIYTSTFPDEAQTFLNRQVLMAPVAYVTDIPSVLSSGKYLWPGMSAELKASGNYVILQPTQESTLLSSTLFLPTTLNVLEYWLLIGSICGYSCQFDPRTFAAIIQNGGDGIAVFTLDFYIQIMQTEIFAALDYKNQTLNQEHYSATNGTPPVYDLSKVTVETIMVYGENDFIATEMNAQRAFSELQNANPCLVSVPLSGFTHEDFVYGTDVNEFVYQPVIDYYLQGNCKTLASTTCVENFFQNLNLTK